MVIKIRKLLSDRLVRYKQNVKGCSWVGNVSGIYFIPVSAGIGRSSVNVVWLVGLLLSECLSPALTPGH